MSKVETENEDFYFEDILKERERIERKLGLKVINYIRNYPKKYALLGGLAGLAFGFVFTYANLNPESLPLRLFAGSAGLTFGSCLGFKIGAERAYKKAQKKFFKQSRDIDRLEKIAEGYYIG